MIAYLNFYHKKLIVIQFSNIHSLKLHFQHILKYFNLFALHIFCLKETNIQNIQTHQEIYNVISNKFNILSCYNGYGTTMLYRTVMFSSHTFSMKRMTKFVHIAICKPPQTNNFFFISILENIIKKSHRNSPTIIIGDLNIYFVIH
jgi:exonuclease III